MLFSILSTVVILFANLVAAEPVQYCKYGAETNEVDFCMGMLLHHNQSTASHDLYLTMSITRPGRTSAGWTALGLGEVMEGSLMFIVYGDPMAQEQPIVSIRKSLGHRQPTLVVPEDMNGADLRVMRSDWLDSPSPPGSAVAMVSLVCYSCHRWPGTEISVDSESQPWIWAWNSKQEIPVYTYDAHLKMHVHHAGEGGWGNFYVDMPSSVNNWHNAPSFPPIRPGLHALGAGESPGISMAYGISWLKHNPTLHLHGVIMGTSFLVLFPLGIVAMRSGRSDAFKCHWIIQLVASGLTVAGSILGLVLRPRIETLHQIFGIIVVASLGVQSVLGWRHHVKFLQLRRRTWLSHFHIWLGRFMLIGGWSNILTGLVLLGYSSLFLSVGGLIIGLEAVGLAFCLWRLKKRSSRLDAVGKRQEQGYDHDETRYFALGESEDEDNVSVSETLQANETEPMLEKP